MNDFKTAEEKAVEWNISARHVQYLCRSGKVVGAIKRAGSWFIPDDTPTPVKNTKSSIRDFKFVGTKGRIFDTAISLFMLKGFNDVSLRDIADSVGIRQSTIYNHFKSKQDILDAIYDFYCYYHSKDRPLLEDMLPLLHNDSIEVIINTIRYDFKPDYAQKMSDIIKIVYQRLAIDERARFIGKTMIVDEGISYVDAVFKLGIKIGRFAPFDTHRLAVFINSMRIFTLLNWIVDPTEENMKSAVEDEIALYKYAITFITDLKEK